MIFYKPYKKKIIHLNKKEIDKKNSKKSSNEDFNALKNGAIAIIKELMISTKDVIYLIFNFVKINIENGYKSADKGHCKIAILRFKMAKFFSKKKPDAYIGLIYVYSILHNKKEVIHWIKIAEEKCRNIPKEAYDIKNLLEKGGDI